MKNKVNFFKFFCLISSLLFILQSVECSFKTQKQPGTMQGRIYVTGNEPFTQLAIEVTPEKVYLISKESPVYHELWKLQGRVVELRFKIQEKTQPETILVESFQLIKK